MGRKAEYIAAIDLGSSKTTCVVCEIEDNQMEVVGFGNVKANGLKKGMIINLEEAVSSVKAAVEEAELMSDISIGAAFVGVAGTHIYSFNSTGATEVTGKHGEIDNNDIQDVIEAAQAVEIPEDKEIIHLIPMEFTVDEQSGITDPIGMTGSRLEVSVHIISGSVSSVKNIISCLNRAGIEVKDIVSNQLASAEVTVGKDERELGIAVADIGSGTTDLAVFVDGHLEYTSVLPIGGDHFTNDIAVGLRLPILEAEKVKIAYADLLDDNGRDEIHVSLNQDNRKIREKTIDTHLLNEILIPRADEIISIIRKELSRFGYENDINAGLVLTGGGALLRGLPEVAENILGLPVRLGTPINIEGFSEVIDNPMFSSVLGILQYGYMNVSQNRFSPFIKK
ncbi:MAG: cell division protein FtsA, partial [Acidobacteria bacterium]|nr:cell division protein FtsA [Acidobacteriota bacterium]